MRALIWFPVLVSVRISMWASRHPLLSKILAALTFIYLLGVFMAPFAQAAGGGEASPDVTGDSLKTASGIRASHYSSLFIDHGWLATPDKSMTAWLMDFFWSIHFGVVVTGLELMTWVLEYGWVDVIVQPFRTVAQGMQNIVGMVGIVPFGVAIMGVLAGIYVLRGKYVKALTEYLTVCLLAVLATGLLANPVMWLTEANGPIYQARDFGANLSAAITSGEGELKKIEANSKEVLGASLTRPLVDVLIARPAEYLSFGHPLTGDCKKTVDGKVKKLDPLSADLNSVRDAVGGCDKDAKAYADSSSFWRVFPVAYVIGGSFWIFLFAYGVMIVLFLSVLGTLWSGATVIWRTPIATIPGTDRSKLLISLALIAAGLAFVVGSQLILAGGMRLLLLSLNGMEQMGMNIGDQLRMIAAFGLILVIGLVIALIAFRKRAKRAAEKAAKILEDLGASQQAQPIAGIPAWLGPAMRHMDMRSVGRGNQKKSGSKEDEQTNQQQPVRSWAAPHAWAAPNAAPTAGGPGAAPNGRALPAGGSTIDVGEMAATVANPKKAAAGLSKGTGSRVAELGSAATRYALAASRGGYAGVAVEAGKDVAQKALSRRIEITAGGRGVARAETPQQVELEGPGQKQLPRGFSAQAELGSRVLPTTSRTHRIQVGADGTANVIKRVSMAAAPGPSPVGTP